MATRKPRRKWTGPRSLEALLQPIDSLVPDPSNARSHDERNIETIKRSLARFGQHKPLVVLRRGRLVLCGNGALTAARQLGWTHVAATLGDWTREEARALAIADNRSAELAAWNQDLLADALSDDALEDFRSDMGFSAAEIDALLAATSSRPQRETATDATDELEDEPAPRVDVVEVATAEPPKKPRTNVGDLWQLGRHRLICGDSTREDVLSDLLERGPCDLVFTDPPYGVNVSGAGGQAIAGDLTFTAIPLFFARLGQLLGERGWLYVCGGWSNAAIYARLWEEQLRRIPAVIVWDKLRGVMRNNGYHARFELIYYGFREGAGADWWSSRKGEAADDVWPLAVERGNERVHPTQKPIAIPARAIRNSCPPGGTVADPFAGAGSTLLAAEQLGRTCYACELEPQWCDVIIDRWQTLTGDKATLVEP